MLWIFQGWVEFMMMILKIMPDMKGFHEFVSGIQSNFEGI